MRKWPATPETQATTNSGTTAIRAAWVVASFSNFFLLTGCASRTNDLFQPRSDAVRWVYTAPSRVVLAWTMFPIPLAGCMRSRIGDPALSVDGAVIFKERV